MNFDVGFQSLGLPTVRQRGAQNGWMIFRLLGHQEREKCSTHTLLAEDMAITSRHGLPINSSWWQRRVLKIFIAKLRAHGSRA